MVGLISVTLFALVLRRIEQKNPSEAVGVLKWLIGLVLGGGMADYVIFDFLLESEGALAFYLIGLATLFLPLGLLTFFDWRRGT